jgi:membrane protein YqaA with SNARE-associated domain
MVQRNKQNYDDVSGIFISQTDFTNLIEALNERGYRHDDLSVLMSEQTHRQYFAPHENTKAPEGATVGSLSGGILGVIIGGLTLAGSVIVPGMGLLVAGPLVGALTAGAVGAATGGLLGALIGAGFPEHEAKFFESALKEQGRILVVAHIPKSESKEIKSVFERYNAQHLKVHSS